MTRASPIPVQQMWQRWAQSRLQIYVGVSPVPMQTWAGVRSPQACHAWLACARKLVPPLLPRALGARRCTLSTGGQRRRRCVHDCTGGCMLPAWQKFRLCTRCCSHCLHSLCCTAAFIAGGTQHWWLLQATGGRARLISVLELAVPVPVFVLCMQPENNSGQNHQLTVACHDR